MLLQSFPPDQVGYAVRFEWPTPDPPGFGHDYAHFTTSLETAAEEKDRSEAFWRAGPLIPLALRVIRISKQEFDLHHERTRHGAVPCTAPDCPNESPEQVGS